MRSKHLLFPGLFCAFLTAPCIAADGDGQASAPLQPSYAYATNGVKDNITFLGVKWKLLLDESNLGGKELEAAELTLPAGTMTPNHAHGSVEIIYVLSGIYEHEVNGRRYRLKPGMIGVVRPGDKVRHLVPQDGDARLLILWAPAGEAARGLAKAQGTQPEPVPESQK
ncbi:MAG: cupin domain-containing protein [Gammaproteobacteria bacterium]